MKAGWREIRYDVVVIGSGVGGIVSAALLAMAGYRALFLEKRPRLGGRFSTEKIGGFKLPTGAMRVAEIVKSKFKSA